MCFCASRRSRKGFLLCLPGRNNTYDNAFRRLCRNHSWCIEETRPLLHGNPKDKADRF